MEKSNLYQTRSKIADHMTGKVKEDPNKPRIVDRKAQQEGGKIFGMPLLDQALKEVVSLVGEHIIRPDIPEDAVLARAKELRERDEGLRKQDIAPFRIAAWISGILLFYVRLISVANREKTG